jgi:TolA-binding protein
MPEGKSPSPSLGELAAALAALRPPANDGHSLSKGVQTIIVAAALGIGAWVMSSINAVQTTLAGVSTTVQSIQKAVGDVQTAQGSATAAIGDMKAQNAQLVQRVATLETTSQRMSDRMRIAEGQKPLDPRDADGR